MTHNIHDSRDPCLTAFSGAIQKEQKHRQTGLKPTLYIRHPHINEGRTILVTDKPTQILMLSKETTE